jgi:hypothetical protein
MNKKYLIKLLPTLTVLLSLFLAAISSYGFYLFANTSEDEKAYQTTDFQEKVAGAHSENQPETAPTSKESVGTQESSQPKQAAEGTQENLIEESVPTSKAESTPQPTPQKASPPKKSSTSSPTPSPTPTSTPVVQEITVEMSIDGVGSFSLSLQTGKNHCELLNHALSENKISSLNMKHNPSLGSYGVYQINGLGQEGQVWWVYEINQKKVAYGCSQVQAKDGDSIEWKYIGPR